MRSGWKLDTQAASEALNHLKTARRVLLPTHQNVDADSLSSVLALSHALMQHDIEVVALISDEVGS